MDTLNTPILATGVADALAAPPRGRPFSVSMTSGQLVVAASLFWALAFNGAFFTAVTNGRLAGDASLHC